MARIYLGLGSNLGDRIGHLEHAIRSLAEHGIVLARSPLVETEPVDCPGGGAFLNGCLCLETDLEPVAMLEAAMRIERDRGRLRRAWNEPRTLDVDLLLVDDRIIDEAGLVVPHPRMCERRFVLEPLAAIAPRAVHPVRTMSILELLEGLPGDRTHRPGAVLARKQR